ncbi:hypothetical protein [Brunnivagina elsteri]|uniref:Uncharacterized protein n=1 Tax=Brunnivagina elsteri CCALA 953 TaxID=987040 RepID=A0A2A2TCH6_9CYAN|nr:hypothetical protein [Calothrix elsteri]PAX51335.1 hypothetical protein CK510_25365 [Calothrix elsteri CCALA 953]
MGKSFTRYFSRKSDLAVQTGAGSKGENASKQATEELMLTNAQTLTETKPQRQTQESTSTSGNNTEKDETT